MSAKRRVRNAELKPRKPGRPKSRDSKRVITAEYKKFLKRHKQTPSNENWREFGRFRRDGHENETRRSSHLTSVQGRGKFINGVAVKHLAEFDAGYRPFNAMMEELPPDIRERIERQGGE